MRAGPWTMRRADLLRHRQFHRLVAQADLVFFFDHGRRGEWRLDRLRQVMNHLLVEVQSVPNRSRR